MQHINREAILEMVRPDRKCVRSPWSAQKANNTVLRVTFKCPIVIQDSTSKCTMPSRTTNTVSAMDVADAPELSKEERKRLKRARREQEQLQVQVSAGGDSEEMKESEETAERVETAEERAERKRQKKERKAAKRLAAEMGSDAPPAAEEDAAMNGAKANAASSSKKRKLTETAASSEDETKVAPAASAAAAPTTVAGFNAQHLIGISGSGSEDAKYQPMLDFAELQSRKTAVEVSDTVMHSVRKYQKPTPIQAQCWPVLLDKRDVIGIAQTGSGKTMGFLLPALAQLVKSMGGKKGFPKPANSTTNKPAPTVLIVSPTRELAIQTTEVCTDAGEAAGVKTVCIYGGVPKEDQKKLLRAGTEACILTLAFLAA